MFEVKTGYGYFKDLKEHIITKAELPLGRHPIKDGYTYVEVDDKNALASIKVYKRPLSAKEVREQKIVREMGKITRATAIQSLLDKGEIDA